jgi:hypothetical protein
MKDRISDQRGGTEYAPKKLGYLDRSHYNFLSLEKHHYNSSIQRSVTTSSPLLHSCHFLRLPMYKDPRATYKGPPAAYMNTCSLSLSPKHGPHLSSSSPSPHFPVAPQHRARRWDSIPTTPPVCRVCERRRWPTSSGELLVTGSGDADAHLVRVLRLLHSSPRGRKNSGPEVNLCVPWFRIPSWRMWTRCWCLGLCLF